MNRIERLSQTARHEALMAVMFLAVCMAAGVWVAAAAMGGGVPGGVAPLSVVAAVTFCLAGVHGREALRVYRLLMRERIMRRYEQEVRL